ncbi:uncharacterized protein SPSC_05754 [Sporisorium scitamineum]|uniref:Uncharacterized protein n=1 Tax=Sporisorium scitamineum TaxID=49012 RepID=A0A127Z5E3_9BASI|nr:uncharacterized protein SPSC_05754 [Sporisorium scitamineum]
MNPYGSGRDAYRPSDSRGRSRSPPPSRSYSERDRAPVRITRDHDAPSKSLPRKPGTSTNALAVNASGSHVHSYASTSASTSSLDRNASISRPHPSDRPEPSTIRRASGSAPATVIAPPAELVERLVAPSSPASQLFEQIQTKEFEILKDRFRLEDQLKKLTSVENWFLKLNSNDPRHAAKLTDQQQVVENIRHKIRSDTLDLWRLQADLYVQTFTASLSTPFAQLESNLQSLSQKTKTERERDRKNHDEFQKTAISYFGQSNRFQSDISKIKGDLSALTKDNDRLGNEIKNIRKNLDVDVAKITDNRERLERLETGLATLQDEAAKSHADLSSAASASGRAASTAPSSPVAPHAPRSHATFPVQDPRPRPAPQPSAASPSAANTTQSTTQNIPPLSSTASTSAPVSEAVTRAQFRKWARDHDEDLELRFEEVIERAVQEATFENQACIEDRIRSLARKWKSKVLLGEGASTGQTQAASNANTGDSPGDAAAATADGVVPMDVETTQHQQTPIPAIPAAANGVQTSQAAVGQTSQNGMLSAPAQPPSQPASAGATAASAPAVHSPTVAATSSTSESAKDDPTRTASASTSNAIPAADGAAQSRVVKHSGSDKQLAVIPVEALSAIRTSLREHETQLVTVRRDIVALRSLEHESLDKLFQSPDKVKQLLEALRRNGLFDVATLVSDALAQLQPNLDEVRTEIAAVRTSQQVLEERVQALEDWRPQIITTLNEKVDWLQREFEMLDDQSSLQGALLVKLAEHANPRRPPPSAGTSAAGAQASAGAQSPTVRSPLAQQAQHAHAPSVAQQSSPHVSTLSNPIMRRPSSGMDAAATALSAHMQPPVYVAPQQPGHHQAYVQSYQQAPQPQPHAAYTAPRGAYPYQDPNHRQGYQ